MFNFFVKIKFLELTCVKFIMSSHFVYWMYTRGTKTVELLDLWNKENGKSYSWQKLNFTIFFILFVFSKTLAQGNYSNLHKAEKATYFKMKDGRVIKGVVIAEDKSKYIVKISNKDTLDLMMTNILEIREWDPSESNKPKSVPKKAEPVDQAKLLHTNYKRNLVSLNMVYLFITNINFSYERILAKGYLGLRLPLTLGVNKTGNGSSVNINKLIAGGCDVNYYIMGQGPVRCFLGPGFEAGQYLYTVPDYGMIHASDPLPIKINYYCIYFNSGMTVHLKEQTAFSIIIGIGGRNDDSSDFLNYNLPESYNKVLFNFGFSLVFKFNRNDFK